MELFLMNRTFQLTVWRLEVQKGAVGQALSSQVRSVGEQNEGEGEVREGGMPDSVLRGEPTPAVTVLFSQ